MSSQAEGKSEVKQPRRARCFLKASVIEAEQLPDGRWQVVKGPMWLGKPVYSEEDFWKNFEQI